MSEESGMSFDDRVRRVVAAYLSGDRTVEDLEEWVFGELADARSELAVRVAQELMDRLILSESELQDALRRLIATVIVPEEAPFNVLQGTGVTWVREFTVRGGSAQSLTMKPPMEFAGR